VCALALMEQDAPCPDSNTEAWPFDDPKTKFVFFIKDRAALPFAFQFKRCFVIEFKFSGSVGLLSIFTVRASNWCRKGGFLP